jgi:dolichol-phosphate mannosyltransferase
LAEYRPGLSLLIPMRNEAGNVTPLLEEVAQALPGVFDLEVLVVNDASTDATGAELAACAQRYPWLRVLDHPYSRGQSRALFAALWQATKETIAVIDGDGQNDPREFVAAWSAYQALPAPAMLIGQRQRRQDSGWRHVASRLAAACRRRVLRDSIRDSGCGFKLLPRVFFQQLPYFDHMHRFMPTLVRRAGGKVLGFPISHRPRTRGVSNYSNWERFWVGISDLAGVWWLTRRSR